MQFILTGKKDVVNRPGEMPALRYNDFSIRNTEKPISRNEATTQKQVLRFLRRGVASSREGGFVSGSSEKESGGKKRNET
jgi:hypothetical protein